MLGKIIGFQNAGETSCLWCKKGTVDTVTAEFANSSLPKGPLCGKCLFQAARIHAGPTESAEAADEPKATSKKPQTSGAATD